MTSSVMRTVRRNAQPVRQSRTGQGEDAQGERRVGRQGDAPSVGGIHGLGDHDEDDRADRHTHDAGDDGALAAVRDVLGPVEDELWDEADAVVAAWRGDDDPAAAALAETADRRVDAALRTLGV